MANKILISMEENLESPIWLENIEPFVQKVLSSLSIDSYEISILFCSDEFIKNLNSSYRNIDAPTDVLSFENGFDYIDEDGKSWYQAGDIAISLDTLPKNCEYFEVSQNEEMKRLLIHGLLHLKGLDHGEEHVEKGIEPVCEMLKIQKQLMEEFDSLNILG